MLRLGYALIDSTSAILTYSLVARIIYIDSQWYPRELASRCDLRFLVHHLKRELHKSSLFLFCLNALFFLKIYDYSKIFRSNACLLTINDISLYYQ